MSIVQEKVIELIRNISPVQNIIITQETNLFDELEFDSISIMKLLVEAEKEFGFEAEDSEESLVAYESVGSFTKFVENMIQK